jgi:hypothetical protein
MTIQQFKRQGKWASRRETFWCGWEGHYIKYGNKKCKGIKRYMNKNGKIELLCQK